MSVFSNVLHVTGVLVMVILSLHFFFFFFLVIAAMKFFFFFYFILLYNTVLVSTYIDLNPPRVYM